MPVRRFQTLQRRESPAVCVTRCERERWRRSGRGLRLGMAVLAVGGLLTAGLLTPGLRFGKWRPAETDLTQFVTGEIRQGRLIRTIDGTGLVESSQNITIASEVDRRIKIIWLKEEGSRVQKGDKVCELDNSEVKDRLNESNQELTEAQAAFEEAREKLGLQEQTNASDISKARLASELAVLQRRKYLEGEYKQELKRLQGDIEVKRVDYEAELEGMEFTLGMVRKGYRQLSDLEQAKTRVRRAQLDLDAEQEKLRVLQEFTYVQKQRELIEDEEEKAREFVRVQLKADIAMRKAKAEFESRTMGLELAKREVEKWTSYLSKCTLVAPENGEVIFDNDQARRYGDDEYLIRVGAEVWQGRTIIRLPDLSALQVEAKVNESEFAALKLGQRARVTIDAFPDETFESEVTEISPVPVEGSWPNYDKKYYICKLKLLGSRPLEVGLRPGLSARYEIESLNRNDLVLAPVQAIVSTGDVAYAWVIENNTLQRRTVQIGASNDIDIEIRAGLTVGTTVVLNPRSSFAAEITQLSKEAEAARLLKQSETPVAKTEPSPATVPADKATTDGSETTTAVGATESTATVGATKRTATDGAAENTGTTAVTATTPSATAAATVTVDTTASEAPATAADGT